MIMMVMMMMIMIMRTILDIINKSRIKEKGGNDYVDRPGLLHKEKDIAVKYINN